MKSFLSNKKGMELAGLQGFVLLVVLVGMLIGIGMITMDKFGAASYYTRTNYNQTIAASAIDNATHDALTFGNVTIVAVWNESSVALPSACYQINATPGTFQLTNDTDACDELGTVNLIYDYKDYATETRTATASIGSEISGIATSWMGLIVTVVILAIILGLVLVAFRPGMDRG